MTFIANDIHTMVMDGSMSNMNNHLQINSLTNEWKAQERKRKISVILRDVMIELEKENKALREENEELKRRLDNE